MSEPSPTSAPAPAPAPAPEPADDGGRQTDGLQAALAAERKQRQALEAQLEQFKAVQQKAAEEAAAKRGEFEQLYTSTKVQLEALQAERDALASEKASRLEAIAAENKARLEKLPENMRALVPEGLSPEAAAAQIRRLESVLADDTPRGGFPRRPGPPKGEEEIPAAAVAEAERLGYSDPRRFYEKIYKPRMERQKGDG